MRKEKVLELKKGENLIEIIVKNPQEFKNAAIYTADDAVFDGMKAIHKNKLGSVKVAIYTSVVDGVEYSLSVLSHVNFKEVSSKEVFEHKICDVLLRTGEPVYTNNGLDRVKTKYLLTREKVNESVEEK